MSDLTESSEDDEEDEFSPARDQQARAATLAPYTAHRQPVASPQTLQSVGMTGAGQRPIALQTEKPQAPPRDEDDSDWDDSIR